MGETLSLGGGRLSLRRLIGETPSLGGELVSLLWMFLCIVLVIALAYWFTKHVVGRGGLKIFGQGTGGEPFHVIARMPTGKDQQLLLVQVGERYFLLGATASQISNLAEFTGEEAAAWQKENQPPKEGQQLPSFKEALQTVLKQRKKR